VSLDILTRLDLPLGDYFCANLRGGGRDGFGTVNGASGFMTELFGLDDRLTFVFGLFESG